MDTRGESQRLLRRGAQRVRRRIERRPRLFVYLAIFGPGVITASAGNDAGGIATFASVGADHGYQLLWVLIPLTFSLGIVQEMCARMGAVTGKGLADLIRERFGVRWTALVMLALLVANGGVTVSEFVGIAAAMELFGIARSFLSHPAWTTVARELVHPHFELAPAYLFTFVAVIGTTISPYMQVFIQSSVVEKGVRPENYRLTRIDVWVGTIFAILIVFFIVISTAATLHVRGEHVDSAAEAAHALRPLAGPYAESLFAIGLLGASMLAAGVLPLATAYSISEALGFEKGVSSSFREAPIFLGIFTFLVALGALITMMPGLPLIRVLLVTQVINGVLLPVILFAVLLLVNDRELMGEHVNGRVYNLAAWATAIIVSALSLLLIATSVFPTLLAR